MPMNPRFGNAPIPLFIGFDPREADAFEVCRASLRARALAPVEVCPLVQADLCRRGLYWRKTLPGDPYADAVAGEAFSTEFTFTRFLVPHLMGYQGWAIFCDCDFLFRADIGDLWRLRDDHHAVMCVKHDHRPGEDVKMDGRAQYSFPRKNWASLMLVNCGHPANRRLTVKDVNTRPKRWLHQFSWLADAEIGEVPEAWNWLAGYSTSPHPKAVHFTSGVPSMPGYEKSAYAGEWRSYLEASAA